MNDIQANTAPDNAEALYGAQIDNFRPGCDAYERAARCEILMLRDTAMAASLKPKVRCSDALREASRLAAAISFAPATAAELTVARMGLAMIVDGIRWVERSM